MLPDSLPTRAQMSFVAFLSKGHQFNHEERIVKLKRDSIKEVAVILKNAKGKNDKGKQKNTCFKIKVD